MWQGRARPSRVNHSRPWGVQGGGYGGFSPPFIRPAQRSFAVFAALCCDPPPGIRIDLRQRLGIIAGGEGFRPLHREVDQLQGDRHFRQRMVAPTAEHSIRADFQRLGFLVAARVGDSLCISVTTRLLPAAMFVRPSQVNIIFYHMYFSPQFLWLMPQERA